MSENERDTDHGYDIVIDIDIDVQTWGKAQMNFYWSFNWKIVVEIKENCSKDVLTEM